ncbi:MAG: alpha/beta fold hydrolase [Candidatus Aenigmatarchaeota archaeon]
MIERKVWFETKDELYLSGILTKPEKTNKCVILCHGLGLSKDFPKAFARLAEKLSDQGIACLRFDFRGHGESQSKPVEMTIEGETKDIEAAIKFTKSKGYKKFAIIATSFAGGPTLVYAKKHKISSIVLICSLIDYHSILKPRQIKTGHLSDEIANSIEELFIKHKIKEMKKKGYVKIGMHFKLGMPLFKELETLEPWKILKNLNTPVLFIHGTRDIVIPVNDSIKYSKIAKTGKLALIKGAGHGFEKEEHLQLVATHISKFLKKNMK